MGTLRIGCGCERCGFQESLLYRGALGERKECTGCIARDLVDNGLKYVFWNVAESDTKNENSYRRASLVLGAEHEELEDNDVLIKVLRQSKKAQS